MRPLVIYASRYGNTKSLAEAIRAGLAEVAGTTPALREVGSLFPGDWREYRPVVIGSPNHWGGPVRSIRQLIDQFAGPFGPPREVAVFDTALAADAGKAVGKLEERIRRVAPSARLLLPGLSGIVLAIRGPLRDGELVRGRVFGHRVAAESLGLSPPAFQEAARPMEPSAASA